MSKTRRQDKRALEVSKTVTADLEVVRNEERLGGVISKKENEDLFFIDTRGKNGPVNSSTKPSVVKKTLKIDQILKPESAYSIGRTYHTKGSHAEEVMISKKSKSLAQGKPSNITKKQSGKSTLYDVWGDEDTSAVTNVASKKSKFVPAVPAVQVPDAAVSYNPSRDEHLIHLESLESKEIERLARNETFKERLPSNQVSSETVAKSDLVAIANRKLATGEISDGDDEDFTELFLGASTKANRKKTIQDRKRQLRHKASLAESKARRCDKVLNASIEKAPGFLAQIQSVQQTRQEAQILLAPIEKEIEQQRKINKFKKRLVLEPLAIKLPEELPSSMRQLAPEGNLVTDRFRSLIERGVVEATTHKILSTEVKSNNRKQGKSLKPRIKMVEKFSYKDFK